MVEKRVEEAALVTPASEDSTMSTSGVAATADSGQLALMHSVKH